MMKWMKGHRTKDPKPPGDGLSLYFSNREGYIPRRQLEYKLRERGDPGHCRVPRRELSMSFGNLGCSEESFTNLSPRPKLWPE